MRPPGVVPASSVPSLRTASAVTHAASRSATLRAGFSSPACGALVSTAKILPWSPVPKYATCPSRLWHRAPDERGVERHVRGLHAGDDLAGRQDHAAGRLALFEVLGGGLAKDLGRRGVRASGRPPPPAARQSPRCASVDRSGSWARAIVSEFAGEFAWLRLQPDSRRVAAEHVVAHEHGQLLLAADQPLRRKHGAIGDAIGVGAAGLVAGAQGIQRRRRQARQQAARAATRRRPASAR